MLVRRPWRVRVAVLRKNIVGGGGPQGHLRGGFILAAPVQKNTAPAAATSRRGRGRRPTGGRRDGARDQGLGQAREHRPLVRLRNSQLLQVQRVLLHRPLLAALALRLRLAAQGARAPSTAHSAQRPLVLVWSPASGRLRSCGGAAAGKESAGAARLFLLPPLYNLGGGHRHHLRSPIVFIHVDLHVVLVAEKLLLQLDLQPLRWRAVRLLLTQPLLLQDGLEFLLLLPFLNHLLRAMLLPLLHGRLLANGELHLLHHRESLSVRGGGALWARIVGARRQPTLRTTDGTGCDVILFPAKLHCTASTLRRVVVAGVVVPELETRAAEVGDRLRARSFSSRRSRAYLLQSGKEVGVLGTVVVLAAPGLHHAALVARGG
mmetsp:Transcript_16814/g.41618  ORF Transcript_16814/g.41618 Transcript_16814/m.41618 type:complete len:376 (+) Transcript_16814:2589-3716(+)